MCLQKIDSTLRGNLGAEIKAIDEVYKPELIVFAPAYPDNNRTTVDAVHMINGIPVTQTEIARDPNKPVRIDNLKILLEEELNESVRHISLKELSMNYIDLDARILTFDAVSNEDLMAIIQKVLKLNKKVLWVGSAGLADALLQVLYPIYPVLIVVGSVSNISREQVNYLISNGVYTVKCNIASLLENEDIMMVAEEAIKAIENGKDTVLVSALGQEDYNKAVERGILKGMNKEDITNFTQNILGKITREILLKVKVSGLFLTGGDTAIGVIKKLGSEGSKILSELLPGIPLMSLKGGICDGLKCVTKAGAFGKEDSIYYCAKRLKERC
ncbi:four-carbon acid sugar kinase family protein [Caloramator sp. mosi_1]|uniref:four-carbon acid sugar kinase family protein n=1 Tax=Caloramator sp. mosi_1 TaxID=3023090 RepID=UPI00235F0199|nr:four-carbon acid sugar kinase family protein [Caloramator sp. mosi_1]WDC84764.1 four-carbon acid sugar kinase family protein [Caloramator sp. mosi_1]